MVTRRCKPGGGLGPQQARLTHFAVIFGWLRGSKFEGSFVISSYSRAPPRPVGKKNLTGRREPQVQVWAPIGTRHPSTDPHSKLYVKLDMGLWARENVLRTGAFLLHNKIYNISAQICALRHLRACVSPRGWAEKGPGFGTMSIMEHDPEHHAHHHWHPDRRKG